MTDLDSGIVAALASGLSEREVSRRLGYTTAQVREALNRRAGRMSEPDTVLRSLIDGVDGLGTIERAAGDARIRQRARRQRARHARLILQRTPARQPM